MGICCICQVELINAVNTLSAKASESILNPEQLSNSDSAEGDVDDDDDEDDLGADPEEPERDEATVAGQIMKLHQEIFSWGMIAGP